MPSGSGAVNLAGVTPALSGRTVTDQGTGAVTLAGVSVTGAGKSGITQSLTAAPTLGALSVAGSGRYENLGSIATTLGQLSVAASGSNTVTQSMFVRVTLGGVTVSAHGGTTRADGAVTLGAISIAGTGRSGVTQGLTGAVTLPSLRAVMAFWFPYKFIPNKVEMLSGSVRSDASAIFQFTGMPNTAITWSIKTGTGTITPITPTTDAYGIAFARYDAGGYTGALVVGVDY